MTTLVDGLRPTGIQNSKPRQLRKDARVVPQRTERPQVRLSPTAAPVDTFERIGKVDGVGSDAMRLAESLSSMTPTLAKYVNTERKKQEDEQMAKLRMYTERFMQDKEMGAVESTQVKEMFPELSPVVAARIAEATGEREAKAWAQDQVRSILEDDNIRLNTANRKAAIAQIRGQAMEIADNKEGFYGTGFLTQLDKSLNEFETSWMRETAAYHEDIQAQSFSDKVSEAIKSGGDLLALDEEWKQSSSLNNLERNKILVNTVTAEAAATNNPAYLKSIPERFLNAETKATIARTHQQIESARYSQWVRGKEIQAHARAEAVRSGKLAIIERMSAGEQLNPSDYRNSPELFEYALRMNSQPTLDGSLSVRNASSVRSNILRAGSTGDFLEAFKNDPEFTGDFKTEGDVTEESLRDHILKRDDLNGAEKQKLLQDIPMLMEGANLLRDQDVKSYFDSAIDDDLKVFAQSPAGQILQIKGINVQGDVRRRFYSTLQAEVTAYIEDNNAVPRGKAKLELLRKAEEDAITRLQQLQQGVAKAQPSTTKAPSTEKKDSPKGNSGGEFITLPNGMKVRKVE